MMDRLLFRSAAALAATMLLVCTAGADTFGTGGNQFTLDFVPISASTNPTPAQTNDGIGIVDCEYRIGVHEITNSQWDSFKAELGVRVYGDPFYAYHDDPGFTGDDIPTNKVSWYEAAQFVNWLNTSTGHQAAYKFTGTQGTGDYTFATWDAADLWGRNLYRHKDAYYFLPDEDEWFKAAYWNATSETIQDYPTKPGDTLHQGDGSSGTGWNYWDGDYATDPAGPWDVGSGSEELNGTYDMMGNNWEWVESPIGSRHRAKRGGVWRNSEAVGPHFRIFSAAAEESFSTGFRVASVPEPGSINLLICGLVGVLMRFRCWR